MIGIGQSPRLDGDILALGGSAHEPVGQTARTSSTPVADASGLANGSCQRADLSDAANCRESATDLLRPQPRLAASGNRGWGARIKATVGLNSPTGEIELDHIGTDYTRPIMVEVDELAVSRPAACASTTAREKAPPGAGQHDLQGMADHQVGDSDPEAFERECLSMLGPAILTILVMRSLEGPE